MITTVAGVYDEDVKKRAYFREGDIKTARIIKPTAFAFNQNGELIFSDSWICRILKIADNKVTIVAGGGGKSAEGANFMSGGYSVSSADGKGRQAGFESPNGIAFDKNGNLFIVDASSNSCIRKLSPDGTVTTFCKQYFNAKTKQYEETNAQGEEVVKTINTNSKAVPGKTDSMLQALQKQIDVAMNDPQVRKYIKDARAVNKDSINKAALDAARNGGRAPQPDDSSYFALPAKRTKFLASLPKKTLTPGELKTYLENIDKKYTSILIAQGNKLPDISSFSVADISYASTLYLLDGSGYQAAWCAIKAAEKAPDDIVVLNNAGGVLNACGFQPVAIPVLQTALDKSPVNSTLQNNIGQSYMALGDAEKAAGYLQQVLSSSPYHPHANFSMACIEYAKGNNSNALNYVQRSLRGSFNDGAMHLLFKLKPDARLLNILKGHYKPTDYFNEDKYHLPPQCENVNDVVRMRGEYEGYREMLERVKKQFEDIENSENELGMKSMMEKTKNYKASGIRTSPFTELGAMMVLEINLRLGDEHEKLYKAQTTYNQKIKDLSEQYHDGIVHAQSCGERLSLGNKYMEAAAVVTREYQKTWLPVFKEYFTDYAFWGRIQSSDKHLQRAAYAGAVRGYLAELLRLAETHFAELCDPETDLKKQEEDYVFKEPDCGIDIGMNLGIGSFRIDCEKAEYHFGGLLVADVVHTYKSHSTTIAIGAGLDVKFGGEKLKAGPIQGGFGATGKMQYFLTFDGTRPSDQGFIWEGAIEYEQKFNTEQGTGVKKIDEVKTNSVDLSARTVLSIHNGFTSTGSLYEQLDKILEVKPEKQENKNVKIFNSHK
jgi:tetratricopeptide (TPR) repeat protein